MNTRAQRMFMNLQRIFAAERATLKRASVAAMQPNVCREGVLK